jgi:hypothetical protein
VPSFAPEHAVAELCELDHEWLPWLQGLHDIASVLLLVCGEVLAYRMLSRLTVCHLRDCTRASLASALETLKLLYPILGHADPPLCTHIFRLAEPALELPYFALSWYMTWFAHDIADLAHASRLFDLFISSHPLMPLYLAAVAIKVGACVCLPFCVLPGLR